jgi:hypothetical protein
VTFNNWTVTPNVGYTITGGTTSQNLTIKFAYSGTYTVSANFTLPGNVPYSATKVVYATYVPTPVISHEDDYYPPMHWFRFFVTNADQYHPDTWFEWKDEDFHYVAAGRMKTEIQDAAWSGHPSYVHTGLYKVMCRAILNGVASAWCSPYWVFYTPPALTRTFDGFEIVNGKIHSPQWLADEVEEVADKYSLTASGEKCYPLVYLIEYNGQGYVFISDGLSATAGGGNRYFTLLGEPVIRDFAPGLWKELIEVTEQVGDEDLLWQHDSNITKISAHNPN